MPCVRKSMDCLRIIIIGWKKEKGKKDKISFKSENLKRAGNFYSLIPTDQWYTSIAGIIFVQHNLFSRINYIKSFIYSVFQLLFILSLNYFSFYYAFMYSSLFYYSIILFIHSFIHYLIHLLIISFINSFIDSLRH